MILFIFFTLGLIAADIYAMDVQSKQNSSDLTATIVRNLLEGVTLAQVGKNALNWTLVDEVGISHGMEGDSAPKQSALKYMGSPKPLRETIVMGEDTRKLVSNTLRYPFRCFGQLECHQAANEGDKAKVYGGSAVLIGPNHALTAAHNVYHLESGEWRTALYLYCGLDGDIAPFDEIRVVRAYVPEEYVRDKNENFDIALLVLESPLGLNLGWVGCMFTKGDTMFSRREIHVTGYPGGEEGKNFKHLWTMANKAAKVEGIKIWYMIHTAGGNSGSPVWLYVEIKMESSRW